MENLQSVLADIINKSKSYWIYAGCFVAGVIVGLWL